MSPLSFLGLVLVALLPFERIPTLEAFGYTVKLSYVAGVILLACAFWQWRKQRIKLSQEETLLGTFWLVAVLSITQSPNLTRSVVIAALWLLMFLLYGTVRRLFADETLRHRAERVLFVVTAIVCLFGIYQFVGDMLGLPATQTGLRDWYTKQVLGFTRIQSVALEPLYFSNYLLFPLFLLLARMVSAKKPTSAQVALGALIVVNIVLGVSRGAYLALIIAAGVMLGYLVVAASKKHLSAQVFVPILATFVIGVGSSLILLGGLAQESVVTRFVGHAQVEDAPTSDSVAGRVTVYKRALDLFQEKPVLGIGIAAFGPRTMTTEADVAIHGYGQVNNGYLEILTETGVLGALAFIAFVIAYFRSWLFAYRRKGAIGRARLVVLGLGVVAIGIQFNFFSTLYLIWVWVFLAWLSAEIYSKE